MKTMKKTNQGTIDLIHELKKRATENDAPIWRDIAKRLEKPAGSWSEVNLSRITRYAKAGDVIVVPGKLLGAGDIDKAVTIASINVSESAANKLAKAGGRHMTILDLIDENPKGTSVRIMG